jgi:hypothetical protein
MATRTQNMGLTAPQMADQVGSTITALATNMSVIDTEFSQRGYNVKWAGAKGDGVTDDTLSIQTAINNVSANGGGVVFFPPGTYIVRPSNTSWIQVPSNITLRGCGAASVLRIPNNLGDWNMLFTQPGGQAWTTPVQNISFEELTFDGNIVGNTPASNVSAATPSSRNNYQTMIAFFGGSNIRIDKCNFINCGGVEIITMNGTALRNVKITNNYIQFVLQPGATPYEGYDATTCYVVAEDHVIANNYFTSQRQAAPTNTTNWTANTAYQVGDNVFPNAPYNYYYYTCTVAGTSGSTEPSWQRLNGATQTDGTVTWQCVALLPQGKTAFETHNGPSTVTGNIVDGFLIGGYMAQTTNNEQGSAIDSISISGNTFNWVNMGFMLDPFSAGTYAKNILVEDNTVNVHQADFNFVEGWSVGLSVNHRPASQGFTDTISISNNVITFQDEGPTGRSISQQNGTFGIGLAPEGNTNISPNIPISKAMITGNVIVNAPTHGILIGYTGVIAQDIVIRNNLIINPGQNVACAQDYRDGIACYGSGTYKNIVVDGNTIIDHFNPMRCYHAINFDNSSTYQNVTVTNNLIYADYGSMRTDIGGANIVTGPTPAQKSSNVFPPTSGTYNVGDIVWNTGTITPGTSYMGYVCTVAGTAGTLSGVTASTTGTTYDALQVLTINTPNALQAGQYISIAGDNTSNRKVWYVSGTNVYVDGGTPPNLTNAAVSYYTPTLKPFGAVSKSVSDVQLTTTSATTVASLTPPAQGNYEIKVYYRVVNAATNLTITVTYTDGSGSLQTYNIVNGGSQAVGPYSCVPVLINATPASPITVTATAGTANNVYVSCTIKPE